jgi:hypothetical protein
MWMSRRQRRSMSARSPSSARRGSEPSRGFARPRPGRGLARVAMAFCLFAAANGQNVAGESGTFVDVTPNVQTQLDGRFGTAPSHRSGHTMVRPQARDRPRVRLVAPPPRVVVLVSDRKARRCSFWHATVFVSRKCVSWRVGFARRLCLPTRKRSLFFFDTISLNRNHSSTLHTLHTPSDARGRGHRGGFRRPRYARYPE